MFGETKLRQDPVFITCKCNRTNHWCPVVYASFTGLDCQSPKIELDVVQAVSSRKMMVMEQ